MGEGETEALLSALDKATTSRTWRAIDNVVAADCTIVDHRPLGFGTIDRARWIESLALRAELSEDARPVIERNFVLNERGCVRQTSLIGTFHGGAPIDFRFISVLIRRGDSFVRIEFFEVTDEAAALSRFEELCASLPA